MVQLHREQIIYLESSKAICASVALQLFGVVGNNTSVTDGARCTASGAGATRTDA